MKHKKQRAEPSKCSHVVQTRTSPNLAVHLEEFAKAVAEGSSHVKAAEICGRKRGSASFLYDQPGVKERIAQLETLAKNATEKAVTENAIKMRRRVDIDRNEIVMRLADIARSDKEPGSVKVRALTVLAKIFMLEVKNLKDLRQFYGWFSDEMENYAETGDFPERLRPFVGEGETETASPEKQKNSGADESAGSGMDCCGNP